MQNEFMAGDRVRHGGKPEWGTGVVEQSQVVPYAGGRAQRVVVRFPDHGRVTLNTAVARLMREEAMVGGGGDRGWLNQLEGASPVERLRALPDSTSDPLSSSVERFAVVLELYRFSTDARSLLDWAVAQTGMNDPLSEFSRQDLEEAFKAYAHVRENKLIELGRELRRQGRGDLLEPRRYEKAYAQQALRKVARAVS